MLQESAKMLSELFTSDATASGSPDWQKILQCVQVMPTD